MSRYIDADKIDIKAREGYNHDGVLYLPYRDIKKSLDSAPSIDIVFCRECKHRNNREKCPMRVFTGDNSFCSCGKRKDE